MHTLVVMSPHDLLFEAERAFWRDNLSEALALGNLAVAAFGEEGNNAGLVTALGYRATTHRELFRLHDSFGAARAAQMDASTGLMLVERDNLGFLYGLSCFHLAEAEMLLRDYEEAIFYFEQALVSFHHTGILAQKGHYCFRLGEAHYRSGGSLGKGHARELLLMGLAQLHEDLFVYPLPYVFSLLVDDHMIFAKILWLEGRAEEASVHVEEARRIVAEHGDLLISKRKFEEMRENQFIKL